MIHRRCGLDLLHDVGGRIDDFAHDFLHLFAGNRIEFEVEAGAARVTMLGRSPTMPRINRAKQIVYAGFTFVWTPTHYIHLMVVTLGACVAFALGVNRLVFGKRAVLVDSVRTRLGLKPG